MHVLRKNAIRYLRSFLIQFPLSNTKTSFSSATSAVTSNEKYSNTSSVNRCISISTIDKNVHTYFWKILRQTSKFANIVFMFIGYNLRFLNRMITFYRIYFIIKLKIITTFFRPWKCVKK
jgi:hypothetical protein